MSSYGSFGSGAALARHKSVCISAHLLPRARDIFTFRWHPGFEIGSGCSRIIAGQTPTSGMETGRCPLSTEDAFWLPCLPRLLKPDPWFWRQQKRAGVMAAHTALWAKGRWLRWLPSWCHAGLMTSPGRLIPHWAAAPSLQPLLMNPSAM